MPQTGLISHGFAIRGETLARPVHPARRCPVCGHAFDPAWPTQRHCRRGCRLQARRPDRAVAALPFGVA
jgi:predicted nucleic acid-binding Zn ribbon protein